MRHLIVGTAGHIDHGKTSLVRALTGIDTDRLEEEKRRGISIDLGFAHLTLRDRHGEQFRLGLVDVPGHERFIKNMLAGVGGIDLVLLVVAANESVKPQTREHLAICRLLRIPRGVVALTKADAADADLLGLTRLEVEELVAGTFLDGAPIVPVSAVTGEGLDDLRSALATVASQAQPKDTTRHLRLPVDRSFSLRGFGTVVTGTLLSGTVAAEQEVEAHPSGLRLRVRGLHTHGTATSLAGAGQRTAVNLSGAEASDLPRGTVLTEPGRFRAVTQVDCRLELLPDAKPLKHRAPVHLHAATAEVEAEVRRLDANEGITPGTTVPARLTLREPLLLLPGDRFVIRLFSPTITIGGGTVLDIDPPRVRQADTLKRLQLLDEGDLRERLLLLAREAPNGVGLPQLVARTGLREQVIAAALQGPEVVSPAAPAPWFVSRERWDRWAEEASAAVAAFHQQQPLLPGLAKEELRSRLLPHAPAFLLDALLRDSKALVAEGDTVRLASHRLALRQDEEEALTRMERLFGDAGLAVPGLADVLAQSGVESSRARGLLQILLRQRRLVRVSEELVYHPTALARLRALLASRRGQRFAVGAFKEWTGVSRKYAIPLLEFLDRERVTRRDGDGRLVL